jgi:glycerophosphoryl diester phosphodiesterase
MLGSAYKRSCSNAPTYPAKLDPRPRYLVDDMTSSDLKTKLKQCIEDENVLYAPHDFSIGHRGACMQFPEHTEESYIAAMEMGAGIVECDVAVTKDGQLVCRHDQCDLHTSTNILKTPLASKCKRTWEQRNVSAKLEVQCCTSDLTLEEFKTLKGRMDSWNAGGDTVDKVMDGTAKWRTTLYEHGKLVTHKESVELIKKWGRKATPELKKYTQGSGMPSYDEIRDKVVQDFKDVGFNASHVWLQSFELADIKYWIKKHPDFGKQAVYLDDAYCDGTKADCEKVVPGVKGRTDGDGGEGSPFAVPDISFAKLKEAGVNFIAPPMQVLLKADGDKYAPSEYAMEAKKAGLKIITWTLERSANLAAAPTAAPERSGGGGWYYGTVNAITNNEGDVFEMLHVLDKDVQIEGIFSDWPATTSFYANCIKKPITCQKADLTLSPASRTTVSFIVRLFAALTLFAFALTWH